MIKRAEEQIEAISMHWLHLHESEWEFIDKRIPCTDMYTNHRET